jgi:hypothetical protein
MLVLFLPDATKSPPRLEMPILLFFFLVLYLDFVDIVYYCDSMCNVGSSITKKQSSHALAF